MAKSYNITAELSKDDRSYWGDGEWVKREDHEKEVEELQDRISDLEDQIKQLEDESAND